MIYGRQRNSTRTISLLRPRVARSMTSGFPRAAASSSAVPRFRAGPPPVAHTADVLLVFCLLIAPAVCSALFAEGFAARLWIGWGAGVSAIASGLALSAGIDWPPAPSIIAGFRRCW